MIERKRERERERERERGKKEEKKLFGLSTQRSRAQSLSRSRGKNITRDKADHFRSVIKRGARFKDGVVFSRNNNVFSIRSAL